MRETKRRLETYSFYNHTGIERHMEEMARKGWLIEKIGSLGWVYRRIEPKNLHFSVTYYPKASEFEPELSEEQKLFYEFCARTGWILAASSAQMQIFYNEEENPLPLATDPQVELDVMHRAAKKSFLPSYFVLLAVSLFDFVLFLGRLKGDPIGLLASDANLFTGFSWTMLFFLCVGELGGYYRWYHQAKKAAEQGVFLESKGRGYFQKGVLFVVIIAFAWWVAALLVTSKPSMRILNLVILGYIPLLYVLVNAVKQLLKKKKASARVNRTLTITASFVLSFVLLLAVGYGTLKFVQRENLTTQETYEFHGNQFPIYQDELPLTVEDLTGEAYDGYIKEWRGEESLLLGQFSARQHERLTEGPHQNLPELSYTITEVKVPALYDICKRSLLKNKDEMVDGQVVFKDSYEPVDPAVWQAKEAYQKQWSDTVLDTYLLCYEDHMVELKFYWEPTKEQIAIAAGKLKVL